MNNTAPVLVFKTTVSSTTEVERVRPALNAIIAQRGRWNFDLEDRDRILRVETPAQVRERVVVLLTGLGFECDELE